MPATSDRGAAWAPLLPSDTIGGGLQAPGGMAPLAGYLDGESGWMCGRVFLCVKFQLVQPVTRALRYPAAQPPSGMTV